MEGRETEKSHTEGVLLGCFCYCRFALCFMCMFMSGAFVVIVGILHNQTQVLVAESPKILPIHYFPFLVFVLFDFLSLSVIEM